MWGYDYDGASNVVDVYVALRGKLGARVQTVRGAGYKLVDPPPETPAAYDRW